MLVGGRGGQRSRRRPDWLRAAAALFAVGWGANQFSSLLLSYRQHAHVGVTTVNALFGVYAVALIPALLIGGPLSDRRGRRMVVPVLGLSAVASVVLMFGSTVGLPALYAGRFLAGMASGLAFAPGTAWVKELSAPPWGGTADQQVGSRRAAVALTAGFGAGPLVAGLAAQWLPSPAVLPYAAHLVVVAAVALPVLRCPETVDATAATAARTVRSVRGLGVADPRFATVVAPMAPWVFGAAAVAFAVLPAQVTARTGHLAVAFAAVVAGLTLLVGVAVQPTARRLDRARPGTGVPVGLVVVAAGMALGAMAAATAQPAVVVVAAAVLGAGYGTCLVAGLLEVTRIAPAADLAGLTSVFYALTYIGFSAPLVVSATSPLTGTTAVLLVASAMAATTALGVHLARPRTT